MFALAYDTLVPLLETAVKPALVGPSVHLDWAQLPATRTVRPYLRSMASFFTCDEQGLRVSMHSPTGILPILAVAGAAAALLVRGYAVRSESMAAARAEVAMPGVDKATRASIKTNMLL